MPLYEHVVRTCCAVRTCFLSQRDEDDLLELLSIMCNQNAAEGKCGNMTKPALILIFVVVSSDKDFLLLLLDRLGGTGKVPIVSEQSTDSPAKFSSSLF